MRTKTFKHKLEIIIGKKCFFAKCKKKGLGIVTVYITMGIYPLLFAKQPKKWVRPRMSLAIQ